MVSLIVVSDVEHLAILTIYGVAIQSLDAHVLPKRVLVARLFEFLLFGGELFNDLLDGDALRLLSVELALLRQGAAQTSQHKHGRKEDAHKSHDDPGIHCKCLPEYLMQAQPARSPPVWLRKVVFQGDRSESRGLNECLWGCFAI